MSSSRRRDRRVLWVITVLAVAASACERPRPEGTAIHLVDRFAEATIEGRADPQSDIAPIEWTFAGGSGSDDWTAVRGLEEVSVVDGKLSGRTGRAALLALPGPEPTGEGDYFHAFEVRLRVSAGTRLGIGFESSEELETERLAQDYENISFLAFNIDLEPGEEVRTYTLTAAHANFETSFPVDGARHLIIRPTDAEGASFALESVRLVTVREHLASIPSGIGWQGLGEIFRETIVARSSERVGFELDLPTDPYLEVALGAVDPHPLTFRIEASIDGQVTQLLRRTVSTPQRWEPEIVDLTPWAGRSLSLSFAIAGDESGIPGYWGSPVIRNRGGQPEMLAGSPAREAVTGGTALPPRGVILIIADTLRRDHLEAYGYARQTAPTVSHLAEGGVLFADTISQATWTKVSVPSILTSLYPTTHGVKDMPDRLPAGVTTLAEVFRSAGWATFATSSVPFTGKLTNLHQGIEVLHERTSVPDLDHQAKTARTFTDRLLDWLDLHREVPFFALLHVFDPHSPFEPYQPYPSLWMSAEEMAAHREDMETIKEFIGSPFMRYQSLPESDEIAESGLDVETYVGREKAWYDASIRAMDVEVARLLEQLDQLGIGDDTLVVFMSDHGEEFLEHGRHFHGYNAYGEMLNVPLIFWWPAALPRGLRVDATVQSIDVMPTILELARLPRPEGIQGQSLLPLMSGSDPASLGWKPRPAVAERAHAPIASDGEVDVDVDSLAVVDGRWKLVWNTSRPDLKPEYELFDHRQDPLDLNDVAPQHPEVVERLADYLVKWRDAALAARVDAETAAEEMSPEEIETLRSLGYIN
jgi:arylsulfatase A-like enzyme